MKNETQRDEVIDNLQLALSALKIELSKPRLEWVSFSTPEQIQVAYQEMEVALRHMENFKLSTAEPTVFYQLQVGRMVADSWPFDSDLAQLVLKATQTYETFVKENIR